jgi:ferredoxin--NADP+ reductase
MFLQKLALILATAAGVQAVDVKMGSPTFAEGFVAADGQPSLYVMAPSKSEEKVINDVSAVDNMVEYIVEKLYDRTLMPSRPQFEGLDSATQGKTMAMQTTPGQLTVPSASLPGLAMRPRVPVATNAMVSSGPLTFNALPGPQGQNHCFEARILRANIRTSAAGTGKKAGVKVVDGREIPFNLFKPKTPLKVKVIKNDKYPHTITENTGDPNWETVHVTFDHKGEYPYVEGMSLGLISPGPDKNGKTPAAVRLYSITSSAAGDDQTSKTVSLCVKRVVEVDGKFANRDVGEDKADKAGTCYPKNKVYRGVASNYICDLKVGDEVEITGPVGTEMLLPPDDDAVYIMLATGTGIAPMRSYLRYLFYDKPGKFKGLAWLFLGVPYSKSLLYDDENQEMKEKFGENFRYEYAISREDKNAAGQKMYIQTKVAEYANEVWDLLINYPKSHVYMCGLKGMESGMAEALGPIAESKGLVWTELVKQWKKDGRWHVEVY